MGTVDGPHHGLQVASIQATVRNLAVVIAVHSSIVQQTKHC